MSRNFYKPKSFSAINQMSESQLRKEYSTMRDIFKKRIERLQKFGSAKAEPYLPGGYREKKTLAELYQEPFMLGKSKTIQVEYLRTEVKELTNLLQGTGLKEDQLSVSGVLARRKQTTDAITAMIKKFHEKEHGKHISKSTLKNFGRFMDAMRQQYGKKLPQSEEALEFFNSLKYNTKRRSTNFIMSIWREYEKNGYQPDNGNQDLFAT